MATSNPERLAKLKEKNAKITAQISKMQAAARAAERKRELRRQIIVGETVLAVIDRDPDLASRVRAHLQATVKNASDLAVIAGLLKG